MGNRSRQDDELRTRVDEVLHYLWDPIGVRDIPAARDEYSSYVGHVCKMLKDHASVEQISKHLGIIKTMSMGMPQSGNSEADRMIASILIDWKETIFDN
jgi:hypothetical protein